MIFSYKFKKYTVMEKVSKDILLTLLTGLFFYIFVASTDVKSEKKPKYCGNNDTISRFCKYGCQKELDLNNICKEDLINTAYKYLNTPRCRGGATPKCVDCSGFLYITFKDLGIEIPHESQEIARFGKIIEIKDSLQPGDLVFFTNSYKTKKLITHSGIYLGNCEFIHTSTKNGVKIEHLEESDFWRKRFVFGTRIFASNDSVQ